MIALIAVSIFGIIENVGEDEPSEPPFGAAGADYTDFFT
jgi:hypothetical protein